MQRKELIAVDVAFSLSTAVFTSSHMTLNFVLHYLNLKESILKTSMRRNVVQFGEPSEKDLANARGDLIDEFSRIAAPFHSESVCYEYTPILFGV
jgi:hypothetical protein